MAEPLKPRVAALAPAAVSKLQDLERALGHVQVIAYEKPAVPARLTPEQLSMIQATERDLNVCLVAYQSQQ